MIHVYAVQIGLVISLDFDGGEPPTGDRLKEILAENVADFQPYLADYIDEVELIAIEDETNKRENKTDETL